MPIEIVSPRRRHEQTTYRLCFAYLDHPTAGFAFDCDPAGKVNVDALNPAARENYDSCLNGSAGVGEPDVQEYHHSYVEEAVGRCTCGELVELGGFTNTCSCGRDYNWSGTLLAPREQWGEDTGESVADILRIP